MLPTSRSIFLRNNNKKIVTLAVARWRQDKRTSYGLCASINISQQLDKLSPFFFSFFFYAILPCVSVLLFFLCSLSRKCQFFKKKTQIVFFMNINKESTDLDYLERKLLEGASAETLLNFMMKRDLVIFTDTFVSKILGQVSRGLKILRMLLSRPSGQLWLAKTERSRGGELLSMIVVGSCTMTL